MKLYFCEFLLYNFFVGCFGDKKCFTAGTFDGEVAKADTGYLDVVSFFEVFFIDSSTNDMFGFHKVALIDLGFSLFFMLEKENYLSEI
jgi:hypothetical protein